MDCAPLLKESFPTDETARLKALHALKILDTGAEHVFDRLTRLACMALDVPIALVSLVDSERQWLKSKQGLSVCESDRSVSFCTHAIQQVEPFVVSDAARDAMFFDNPLVTGEPHTRAYVGIPLRTSEGHAIGTLCAMDTQPRYFSDEEIDVLQDLARMVIETIEQRHLATTDSLTGALTRRGFDREMEREFSRARRFRKDLYMVSFDLDHFKAINDRYGHAVGDIVLKSLVTLVKEETRAADLLARTGGEEFVLALPDTDQLGAQIVAERIRCRIAGLEIHVGHNTIRAAASFGIAPCDLDQLSWSGALEKSATALDLAKRSGRNLTLCYENLPAIFAA